MKHYEWWGKSRNDMMNMAESFGIKAVSMNTWLAALQNNKEAVSSTSDNSAMFQLLSDIKDWIGVWGGRDDDDKEILTRINAVLAQQKHS